MGIATRPNEITLLCATAILYSPFSDIIAFRRGYYFSRATANINNLYAGQQVIAMI
jgi:hypothetical protein